MKSIITLILFFISLNALSAEYFLSCKKINYETYLYLDLNISNNKVTSDLEIKDLESNFNTTLKVKIKNKNCDISTVCLIGKDKYNKYLLYIPKKNLVNFNIRKELILEINPTDTNSILTNKYVCN